MLAEQEAGSADGLGLADAIGLLRDELLQARAAGGASDIQLPVESMTVELKVTATRSADGKAGFKVPIVELELGGSAAGSGGGADGDGRVRGAGRPRGESGEGRRGQLMSLRGSRCPVPLAARVVEVIADRGATAHPRYRYGSGCIVAGRTVLTAAHVVAGAASVQVRDSGQGHLPGEDGSAVRRRWTGRGRIWR